MNLSFIPGDLHLNKNSEGVYVITLRGEEVFTGKIEKKAIAEYNKIRKEMEAQFPAREMTVEEKRKLLEKFVMEKRVGLDHNSYREPKKEKKSGSTRTFG